MRTIAKRMRIKQQPVILLLLDSLSRQIPTTLLSLPQIKLNTLPTPRLLSLSRPQSQPRQYSLPHSSTDIPNPVSTVSGDETRSGSVEDLLKGVRWSRPDCRIVDVRSGARARFRRMEGMRRMRWMELVDGRCEGREWNERMAGRMEMDRYRFRGAGRSREGDFVEIELCNNDQLEAISSE